MGISHSEAYAAAGVDIEAGYQGVKMMNRYVQRTLTADVISDLGGFGGLFSLDLHGLEKPVLVSGTDGVGTKQRIAQLMDRHSTVGIDCVAMCVNDIICCGAKPLFFLDYIAIGKNIPEKVVSLVSGVSEEDSDATEEEHEELFEYMKENEQIAHCNRVQMTKISAPKGSSNISIYLFVPESLSEFARDVTLKNRITGETYELTDEGAAISEKTASLLGLKVGDMIPLKKGDKEYKVRVAVITENYMSHYLYMTPRVYEQTFGEKPEYENIVFTMQEDCKDDLEMAGSRILANPGALSISYTSSLASQVDRMLSTLDAVILVLIVSAGMLAFVVLYNLNNINITERQRELATLKVLGFYDGEVSQYVLRENVILTVLGIMFGAVFGILIHRYVITTVEVDAVMFGRNIKLLSFLYSGILTSIFSIVVNGVMHFKLKTIDMVESLKSVE